ncbi:MAG: hypothetical protein IT516_06645 [Burkholderiales bacterium]|nr:hypothetical protein [Burkholderiales bacterium]
MTIDALASGSRGTGDGARLVTPAKPMADATGVGVIIVMGRAFDHTMRAVNL